MVKGRRFPPFPFQYPVELLVDIQTILVLAGNLAGVTADALGGVYG